MDTASKDDGVFLNELDEVIVTLMTQCCLLYFDGSQHDKIYGYAFLKSGDGTLGNILSIGIIMIIIISDQYSRCVAQGIFVYWFTITMYKSILLNLGCGDMLGRFIRGFN